MSTAAAILSDSTPPLLSLEGGDLWERLRIRPRTAARSPEPAYLAPARVGDEGALALLYAEFREPVWRLCRRLPRREADAEDVLQATFIKAFVALPRFRGDASLNMWLFRIAVNEANTLLRRDGATLDHVGDIPEDERPVPGVMDDAERVAARCLLAALKPDSRVILVLRYWEELSYDEIAGVLALPLPAVKMRLHRAKEAFRALYTGAGEPE